MVSDEEIVSGLKALLKVADLSTTTERSIRKQLETSLGVDLSEKKLFIRSEVENYLQTANVEEGEGENGGEDQAGDADEDEDPHGEVEDEDDDDNNDDDVNTSTPRKKPVKLKPNPKPNNDKKRKAGSGGLSKEMKLSEGLASLLGAQAIPRTQVVKLIWEYIREHNLQEPQNKRNIIFDERLRTLFGTDRTDMFNINKLLSNHILPSENGSADGQPRAKKAKTTKEKKETKDGEPRKPSSFSKPLPISQALIDFLGTKETELSRSRVVQVMWQYIKKYDLQDPSDKKMILCDQKLKKLFKCDTFLGFGMTKLLSPHFLKSS